MKRRRTSPKATAKQLDDLARVFAAAVVDDLIERGGVAERPIAPVSKTGAPKGAAGSNPAPSATLPALRFEIPEAASILRISKATLYKRIKEGLIQTSKDGGRTYITRRELRRYIRACEGES